MIAPKDLFDLAETEHASLFDNCANAWDALSLIKGYLASHSPFELHNTCDGRAYIGDQVYIGEGTVVEDGAMIKGPAIIGKNCQIRHNAYIRENVIIGDDCVVGNSCELKNALLFNGCQVPHFNYVGDAILGHKAHLGAGVKISNVKLVPGNVMLEIDSKLVDSGLRKFGALIGDLAEVGCNAVLNPGTILGRNSLVYPNTNWRGILPADSVAKNKASISVTKRRS